MAHSKQALKRIRQNEKNRIANKSRVSRMKTAVKKLMAVVATGDKGKASELLPNVCKLIDKVAQNNVIHKHNASRRKGQVMRAVSSMK